MALGHLTVTEGGSVMVRLWFVSTVDSRGRVWRTSVRAASSWHAAALVSGRVVSVVDGGAV